MPASPAVSIVLPTYNRRGYLQQAVHSVLAQSWSDWELLIVDDGSNDDTIEWAESLDDARVRLLQRSHSGNVSAVRNAGLQASRADWIAFLDDDDAWRADKLERQMALHIARPQIRWSYTRVTLVDAAGAPTTHPLQSAWQPHEGFILRPLLRMEAQIALPSVMVRRELLEAVGGFDESLLFTEDYDLWFRLAPHAPCGALDEPVTIVRSHYGSRTAFEPQVNLAWMQVYAKCAASAAGEERRICRQREAFHAIRLARQYLDRHEFGLAARALGAALRLRPFYPWAWRTVAKAAARFMAGALGQRAVH